MLHALEPSCNLSPSGGSFSAGPWPIGAVVQELLEQYEIDLMEESSYVLDSGVLDDALAMC